MEQSILKYLKIKGYAVSIKEIKSDFNIRSSEELDSLLLILKLLERKGEILVNSSGKYVIFPKDGKLIQGKLLKDKKGNYVFGKENIYIEQDFLGGALIGDIVLVVKSDYACDKRQTGKVKKIIERRKEKYIFECRVINNQKKLVPIGFDLIDEVSFSPMDLSDLVEGSRVQVDLSYEKTNGRYIGKVIKYVGHKDDPDIEVKEIVIACGGIIDFSKESLAELESIPTFVGDEEIRERKDFRDKIIFTIDKEKTKDMDDAISLEINERGNYVLGAYIADVAHYVRPGMALFEEAIERGTSIYALDYCVPMLPHKISNGICSLNEGCDRLAKACIMEIDKTGRVIDYQIVDCVINSKKKMSYEKVNQLLEDGIIPEGYEPYQEVLKLMWELATILNREKIKQGKLDFSERELDITEDASGKVINIEQRKSGFGEHLIENFMILANEIVASNYCYYPFVYRVHNKPNEETIRKVFDYIRTLNVGIKIPSNITNPRVIQNILMKIRELPEYEIISDLILKGMTEAYYGTENVGHFALASPVYTHFTSPIRRTNDLIVHTLIDLYNNGFDSEKFDTLETKLKAICIKASAKEKIAETIERRVVDYKIAEFLKDNIGNSFGATIMYISSKSVTVKLDNGIIGHIGMKKFNNCGYSYKPNNTLKYHDDILTVGSHITVTVLDPQLYHNQTTFGFVKDKVKELKKR